MKIKKHLHTQFLKFIVEKYDKEIQKLPEAEETKKPNKKVIDNIDDILNYEDEIEAQDDNELDDDENVDDLLKEYREVEKNYWRKRNDKIYKRR
ncbi:hypothetical protein [Flavobacterium poyangense]|uniref:hypothetical protein n=1 Tax=Flavobacterium poyangense TaxID=2204302 RepID=UPI001422BAC9|nr:hypothetical protein [Flavobacterium sp. JXAS1]